METTTSKTIGEMVAENYRTAPVFKKYGIDFCCKGGRSIEDACAQKGMDPNPLLADLERVAERPAGDVPDYNTWPLDRLADHIEKVHHSYVENASLEMRPFLDKVCNVHGDHHPVLFEIRREFYACAGELAQHMKKEELILFPQIRKMAQAVASGGTIPPAPFGTVRNPIAMMMEEHEIEGDRFERISELTEGFNPPEWACNTFRVTYSLLKEFQDDLHAHIHLENNILFPKAVEMEAA
ncbi:MAG: iron-sulfur cluster repair di-iron protein [Flavobacteriales bacterium]|nr:iron-sulfur cluster repair di-iron protein [Flavobacteriales bacterium]